ncbi:Thoeris anti-defense Tad2 family protein [Streptomyces sp. NPDC054802]|jgi:hypothetical protein
MSWSDVLKRGTADSGLTFARSRWTQPGKFVWVAPRQTIRAPTGDQYPLCTTVYFKDVDDLVKPYFPSMDGMTEADDWYVGVSGRPPEQPAPPG